MLIIPLGARLQAVSTRIGEGATRSLLRLANVEEKSLAWLAAGVKVVLILDPANRTVRIAEHAEKMHRFDEHAQLTIEDVLPGWQVAVADLFR